jgi:uncharacterized RDD family membrane protein YckC
MQQSSTQRAPSRERPAVVTVYAILAAIAGVGTVLGALAGGFVIHGVDSLDVTDAVIVLPALALAALYLTFAYAAWNLRPWGWTLGMIAAVGTIVYASVILITSWGELMRDAPPFAVMGVLVVVIATAGLVTGFRPEVRAALRRS